MKTPNLVEIEIAQIVREASLQLRGRTDPKLSEEYAAVLREGGSLPPPVVFGDGAGPAWPGDGNHTIAAHELLGRTAIQVELRPGGRREALNHACSANKHGLSYSNAAKRRIVELRLKDSEWSKDSDRRIAAIVGVTHPLVGKVRKELLLLSGKLVNAEAEVQPVPEVQVSHPAEPSGNGYHSDDGETRIATPTEPHEGAEIRSSDDHAVSSSEATQPAEDESQQAVSNIVPEEAPKDEHSRVNGAVAILYRACKILAELGLAELPNSPWISMFRSVARGNPVDLEALAASLILRREAIRLAVPSVPTYVRQQPMSI